MRSGLFDFAPALVAALAHGSLAVGQVSASESPLSVPAWRQDWGKELDSEVIARAMAGTPSHCWQQAKGWNYEDCCLDPSPKNCWPELGPVAYNWLDCCTGQASVFGYYQLGDDADPESLGPLRVLASPYLSEEVWRCMAEGTDARQQKSNPDRDAWSLANAELFGLRWHELRTKKEEDICRNTFTTAVKCIAALPSTSVVLDLLWGGGCSATAAFEGLQSQPRRPPAEIFGFELSEDEIHKAIHRSARFGQPLFSVSARNQHDLRHVRRLFSSSLAQVNRTRGDVSVPQLAPSVPGIKPVVFHARLDTGGSLRKYRDNPLDILCRHRLSLDILVVDSPPGMDILVEWEIMEAYCPPKWVLLNNRNLPRHASGRIFSFLQQQPEKWRLELMGAFRVADERWYPQLEQIRTRSWAAFRRLTPS